MAKLDWTACVSCLYGALDLERRAVGVRLLRAATDYNAAAVVEPRRPMNYCHAVFAATRGKAIKLQRDTFLCAGGCKALGVNLVDDLNGRGQNWTRLGLYHDADLSREVRDELRFIPDQQFGVITAPIETYTSFPDVVIVVGSPFVCMRLMQAYAYSYGINKNIRILGNQAFCWELTARPYLTGDVNVSLLCIGTRHRAAWKDNEMAVGIPAGRFAGVVQGLMATIDPMESDKNKRSITKRLSEAGIEQPIRYGYNYYQDC